MTTDTKTFGYSHTQKAPLCLLVYDCVVVHFQNRGPLRIGTDDAENLARFLQRRGNP